MSNFTLEQLLISFLDSKTFNGFIIKTRLLQEENLQFSSVYRQKADVFIGFDNRLGQTQSLFTALWIYLDNAIVSALHSRPQAPESGSYVVCGPLSSGVLCEQNLKSEVIITHNLRILHSGNQWHNGGFIWIDHEELVIGFN